MTTKFRLPILLSLCALAYSQQKPNPNFTGGEVKTITENSDGKSAHFYFSPGSRTKWRHIATEAAKSFWWRTASVYTRKRADP